MGLAPTQLDGPPADALEHAYRVLGFERAAGGDEMFRQLVLVPTRVASIPAMAEPTTVASSTHRPGPLA